LNGKTWVAALLGGDLVALRARVLPADVVFIKSVLEASEGVGAIFAEPRWSHPEGAHHDGGSIVIAAPRSRFEELEEMIRDLRAELSVFEVAAPDELAVRGPIL
jgi:hypothetical protein